MTTQTSTIERIAKALFEKIDVSGKSWEEVRAQRPDVAAMYVERATIAIKAMIPPEGDPWEADVQTREKHAENILAERFFEEE